MNRIIILSIALIISIRVGAQAPQKMSYQAVIRNNGGNGVANANVGVKISVLQASATGTAVYVEKHTTISDSNGLINLEIGGGTPLTGTFASINWANGPYFLKTETDPKGGTNYTIVGTSQLLSVPYALFAANSGTPGPAGTNGLNILNGVSNPSSSTGVNGEFYINTLTNTLFGPKAGNVWPAGISIVGPSGAVGGNGSNGLSVLNGTVNPGPATGSNGEFYINTVTNTIFGPKSGSVWPAGVSIIGPSGAVGANGSNGLSVLNGTVNPGPTIGSNGEFYINTVTNTIFGPKAGNVWPTGISIVGPSGAVGANGPNGLSLLNGTVNPGPAIGQNGEFYINTITNTIFGPKAGSVWPAGVSVVGPSGAVGANGLNGLSILNGTINPTPGVGQNGEFYINTVTKAIFGPKAGSVWPAGVSIVGPSGAVGANGLNGLSILNGTTNPAPGVGQNGEFYINTVTNTIFGPKAGGSWPSGILLIGPTGAVGSNGLNILNGTSDPTAAMGINGEFYINTTTKTLFGPKSAGTWPIGTPLVGPAGTLSPGNVAGDTPYWNGTSWVVDNSNIFNAGGNVGIGTSTPVAKLDVLGTIKINDGTQGSGKVLTSDATGLATWATPSDGGWGLTGTNGTIDGTNFIGTTDYAPLNFKVNNQKAGRIDVAVTGSVFLGYQAGNTYPGSGNTGIGYQALFSNSMYGQQNTANGNQALFSNTDGQQNTATGYTALFSNTYGRENTATGFRALKNNISGFFNTATGSEALLSNTTGAYNTAIGNVAAANNTTGESNTAIGYGALSSNPTGSYNTAIGRGALALQENTLGDYNTAVGYAASVNSGEQTNSTAIGSGAIATASNMVRIGNGHVTSINGAVEFTVVSDKRFKKDIQENVSGLPFIMKLRPVTYHLDMNKMASFMKTPENLRSSAAEAAKEKILQTGFIAQEVENAAQELGYDFSGVDKPDNDADYYGLRYAEFTVPLVKAVQEQQKIINELQLRIQQLEEQSRSKQAALQKSEAENAMLKSDYNSRLKKLEEMVGMKAQK